MNLLKKAVSFGTSAALLASLLATAAAPSALAVGTISNIVYQANGAVAGSAVPVSATAAFATFNFTEALQAGTYVYLTLPSGTAISATCASIGPSANFTLRQSPATPAVAPSAVTLSGTTLGFLVPAAAIGVVGGGVSIFYTSNAGPCVITNPTTATSNGTLTVAIQGNGSASLTGITFVAGPADHVRVLPALPTIAVGSTLQFTAQCEDAFNNITTGCGASGWTSGTPATATIGASTGLATALANGTTLITATPTTGTAGTTTLTVANIPSSVACLPVAGSIVSGTSVTCTFTAGNGATFLSWTAAGFTPVAALTNPASFVAGAVGTGTISANFTTGPGGPTSPITNTYTITAAPPVVPPATPGTVTLSATKSVVRGGPKVDPVYTFTEGLAGDWAAGQFVTVCFLDKSGGNTLTISGGTLAGPDALGFTSSSYSVSGNCFTVTLGSTDNTRLEAFTVSDLMFKASSAAVPGAIQATYTTNMGGNAAYFGGTSRTATGTLAAASTLGATSLLVNLGISSGLFVNTGAGNGKYLVNTGATNAESLTGTAGALTGTGNGQQVLTTVAQASNHAFGEPVTQTVIGLVGTIPSPGNVVDALSLVANSAPQLLVGVTNQTAGTVTLAEQTGSTGLLALNTVITLKIQEPGVQFSALPTYVISGGSGLTLGAGTLSLDRTSATFTVTTADTSPLLASITFSMKYDVAATAKTGDAVNLAVTAGSIATTSSPVINAYIGSMIFVTSTAPTVFINVNDQAMGKAVMTEVAAGSIGSAAGGNTLYACLTTGESWTRAPWLVRTAGDILITNPDLLTGSSKARGTQVTVGGNVNCYAWAVYTASTVASTLEIQGVDATGAATPTARISVPNGLTPGPTYLSIGTMASISATSGNLLDIATVAVRAFQFGVTVSADGQPYIAPGTVSGPAGNLTIAQTGANLLVAGELITCTILPRTNQPTIQDTFMASANQNLLPVVSTDGVTSGLQAHLLSHGSTWFTIMVDQGATVTPGGKIFVNNINYTTTADAILGPVLVECMNDTQSTGSTVVYGTIGTQPDNTTGTTGTTVTAGFKPCFDINGSGFKPGLATIDAGTGSAESVNLMANAACTPAIGHQQFSVVLLLTHIVGAPITETIGTGSTFMTGAAFDQFVSNAIIGTAPVVTANAVTTSGTALGATKVGPFTITPTKVAKLGKYVTWKFSTVSALIGKAVVIYIATKNSAGKWSAFKQLTTRRVDASGNAYFWWRTSSKAWISVRAGYLTTLSVATQARWL